MVKYVFVRIGLFFITLITIISMLSVVSDFVMLEAFTRGTTIMEMLKMSFKGLRPFWLNIISDWNWGRSGLTGEPAWEVVSPAFQYTIGINVAAFLFYVPFGLILGILQGLFKDSLFDKLASSITQIFSSIPIYISIDLLYWYVGYKWGLLPYRFPIEYGSIWQSGIYLIIPAIALSTLPIARISRAIRSELVDTFEEDYLVLARTKGFTHRQALIKHSLKNTIIPVLPQIFGAFMIVLNWSFLVEIVYMVPGVAVLLFDSLIMVDDITTFVFFDASIVVLIGAFYTIICLLGGFILDMANAIIDPRIKLSVKK